MCDEPVIATGRVFLGGGLNERQPIFGVRKASNDRPLATFRGWQRAWRPQVANPVEIQHQCLSIQRAGLERWWMRFPM